MQKVACGHLFNGIGGFQLAAYWMGWENVFHVEIDPFCNKVVAKHFPNSICYGDIKETDLTRHKGSIDLITGGFPCQPVSKMGKRRGDKDARWLWPEYLAAVRQVEPIFVIVENVANLVRLGVEQVLNGLEGEGYVTQAFIIPASAVGAFHGRDRIWIIGVKENAFHPNAGCAGSHRAEIDECGAQKWRTELRDEQIRLPGSLVSEGVRRGLDTRVFGTTDGVSSRVDRIRALGNAIVPQVALVIFQEIEAWLKMNTL